MPRGLATAASMADLVISWNTIRRTGIFGLRYSSRCQEMASPSRSSSVARYSSLASFTRARSSLTTCLPRSVNSYVGLKPLSTSIDKPLLGRSATWPTDARTSYALPRNLEMVFAFAGDSTMTRGLGMARVLLGDAAGCCQGACTEVLVSDQFRGTLLERRIVALTLDVDVREDAVEPLRQPPVALAEQ